MALLLDTSVAILLRDADGAAAGNLVTNNDHPRLSIITRVELEGGVVARPDLAYQRRSALDTMLRLFPVLDFDASCANAYRRIVESAGFSRRKIADRMIAATALAHGLTLATASPRDFEDIPGLAIDAWDTR